MCYEEAPSNYVPYSYTDISSTNTLYFERLIFSLCIRLRMCYEEAPSNYVPRVEMYTLYILYCSEVGQTNIVNSNDFNNIIRYTYV